MGEFKEVRFSILVRREDCSVYLDERDLVCQNVSCFSPDLIQQEGRGEECNRLKQDLQDKRLKRG